MKRSVRRLQRLRGKVAIANAKLAYRRWQAPLRRSALGAPKETRRRPQQLLWASTGTKNPAYSDVLYIDELIGPETVNTMPAEDHGRFPRPRHGAATRSTANVEEAAQTLAALDRAGISLDSRHRQTRRRRRETVLPTLLTSSMARLPEKRRRILGNALNDQAVALPRTVQERGRQGGGDVAREGQHPPAVERRRHAVDRQRRRRLAGLARHHRRAIARSAAPERICRRSAGPGIQRRAAARHGRLEPRPRSPGARPSGSAPGFPKLHVLDSTDPQQVGVSSAKSIWRGRCSSCRANRARRSSRTCSMDYFFDKRPPRSAAMTPARHFVAITDPGSQLEKTAKQRRLSPRLPSAFPASADAIPCFRHFGMVPLAAMGRDVRAFLESARIMARSCGPEVPPAENPGVELGLVIGVLARGGRDKVTIVASPTLAAVWRLGGAVACRIRPASTARA